MSMENGSDALSLSYDGTKKGFRTISPNFNVLLPFLASIDLETFDYVDVAYSDTVTEVYSLLNGGATGSVELTFTVTYTDASKSAVSNILKA